MPTGPTPTCELAPGLHERLVAMARAALPNEACGLLWGPEPADWEAETVMVGGAVAVRNAQRSPHRFSLDGGEMLRAEDRIDAEGARVIGVFHSHPTRQARPSPIDIADAAAWDPQGTQLHVIVSMQGFVPTIRAWRLTVTGEAIELPAGQRDDSHTVVPADVEYSPE